MIPYEYDKIGSFHDVECGDCGWIGKRSELVLCQSYDDRYDEFGKAFFVENYFGCPICKSDNVY